MGNCIIPFFARGLAEDKNVYVLPFYHQFSVGTQMLENFVVKVIGLERAVVFKVGRGGQELSAAALLVRNSSSFMVVTLDSE